MAAVPATAQDESAAAEKRVFDAVRFGVPIQVQLYASDDAAAKNAADAAFEEARRLDRVFSDYHPDSEARRLTDGAAAGEARAASRELYEMLQYAEAARVETDGAFDVTLGRLSHLWRKARRLGQLPPEDELAAAKSASGPDAIRLQSTGLVTNPVGSLVVNTPGVRLDFGGVVKGHAVDRMCAILAEADGVDSFLVDAGGDIRVGGRKRRQWTIAVRPTGDEPLPPLTLSRTAVATSGDASHATEIEGRRYSHIIDPATKEPLDSLAQVTVVAETAAAADALASALSVMGPGRGLKWLDNYRRSGRETFGQLVAVRFEEDGRAIAGPMWGRLFRRRGEAKAATPDATLSAETPASEASNADG